MSCRATRGNFSAYIESELSESERRRVREHLDHCASCARELEAFKKTMTLLRWIPPVEASEGFAAEVMVRVRAERAARPRASAWERALAWWERVRPAMPWDGLELPVPALASAGALGLVAGVILTLELVGMPTGVADAPQLPGELATLTGIAGGAAGDGAAMARDGGSGSDASGREALVANARPAGNGRQPFRSDLQPAYPPWAYGAPRVTAQGYGARMQADGRVDYGNDRGALDYSRRGWSDTGYSAPQLEGPAPVAVVEYVLERLHEYQQRQPVAQDVPQLPVGLHIENGYVTF
jgi:anti-sigma factor RsiW